MADFESKFRYDSDFSKVTDDIKALVREATNANSVFAQLNKTAASVKMEAARSFSAQAGFAGFKAQVVDLTGATEKFGEQLMKNKLTMKEYFSEAAKAYKKDSKARALAEREVRRAQSAVVGMGDIGGKRKGILLTPDSLDMSKTTSQLQVASKQYEIFNDLVQKGSTAMVNWGKNTQWAGRQLTVGLTVPMGIFTSQALKAFAGLDAEITRFRKVYGSELTGTVGDATEQMVSQIRNMGSEFAKQYGIASKETMALAADLAAAGLEGQKLANAVNQTTRMMVLGEVDRQEAMKATLSIQTAFNQNSRELAKSIDFLNAVENQTSASLQDLVEAIPKTGPVIQALGGDIKDLSVLMTAMREGGIGAAEGANALKSGMASLISPTSKAIEVAKQFGIDLQGVVTANKGQLMPMLTAFQEQLSGLDDWGKAKVIEEIFGKYQFARISALFDNLNAQGSQTVGMMKLMTASADDLAKKSYSELKAQENAPSTRLAAMQQQLQEQLIKVGADLAQTLLPIMQGALDILQKIVDGFNNLPGPIKTFAKIIGGITAASGPILMLAGIFGNLIGNAIKFGMSIVNLFKKMTGHPVKTLQILSDEELAAKLAANQLTGAYDRQRTSVMELNAALDVYIANLKLAASIAPPGAVRPGGRGPVPPVRRADGGIIYAQNGVDSGGRINGYGGGDTVPALLEPGEFVINKKSSSKHSGLLRDINAGKDIPGYSVGTPDGVANTYKDVNLQQSETGAPIGSRILKNVIQKREGDPILESLGRVAKRMSESYPVGSEVEKWGEKLGNIKQFHPDKWAQFEPYPVNKLPAVLQPMAAGLNDIAEMHRRIIAANPRATLAASHMADTGVAGLAQLEGGSVKLTAVKEFIGTTMLESFGFNSLIQSMGGGSKPNPTKVANNLIANLPETHPLRAAGTLEKLTAMMSGAGAPVTANDTKLMIDFFKEIDKNPGLKTAFNLNSGTNAAQFNESKAYLNFLSEMIDDPKRFNEFRKNQMIQAAFTSVKETELANMLGTVDKLKQYEILDKEYSKVEKILNNPKLTESQRRAAVEKTVATISKRITGRDVLQGKRLENLRYKQAIPAPENATTTVMTAEGKPSKVIVAGKELYRDASGLTYVKTSKGFIPYDMEKNAAMNKAVPLQENQIGNLSKVAEEKFSARAAFTEKERRGWAERLATKTGPRGVRMMYWRGIPIRFAKNGGLIPGYAGGGLVGGLMQIMSRAEQKALPHATEMLQKGFKIDSLKGAELAALRKKQTGLIHDTKMFRGARYNWDAAEVGQVIKLPGSQSWSTREDIADTFRAMNEFGGEKRYSAISNQRLEAAGIDPKTFGMSDTYGMFRIPTNTEEALLGTRLDRIQAVQRYRKGVSEVKALEAERKALIDSPYPSQESTLFGLTEPKDFEVANRKRQIEELDRKIRGSKILGKEQGILDSRAARAKARDINDSPVIFEMVTPKGTQTLPLSDITGRGRYVQGMGAMDEFEHLITDGMMRVVKKYVDERGVKRIVGEFVDAKRFAFGGPVGKWNMPFKPNDPAMAAIKEWTGGEMGQFRNTAMHPILRGQKAVGYRRGLNPNFNKDKLYKILNALGIMPEGIVMRRASTLNPGVSTEFADTQQLKLMEAIRTGKFDEIFGMELNQKGLASYTSLDPKTGATGFTGINRFHMREEPMAWKKDLRNGTGRIERGTGNTYAGPKGFEQVYFEHRTSGVERGRDISAAKVYGGQTTLDEILTYKMNSIIDAVSTDLKTRKTIFHTKGVPGFANGGQLSGYGGGDKVPAMLEPGEFIINKESSAKYAPLLQNINKGTVPGFEEGWTGPKSITDPKLQAKYMKGAGISAKGGGMMGAGMSMMFLPMSIDMFKTAQDPLTKALGAATIAMTTLQVGMVALGAAIKMNTLAQGMGGWGSMLTKKIPGVGLFKAGNIAKTVGTARVGANPVLTGKLAANQAKNAGGGFISQKVASIGARGIAKGGATAVATRIGLGLATKAIPIVGWAYTALEVGKMIRDWKVGQWVEQITDVFGEATEMAKVYNIELKKTEDALKANTKAAQSFGLAANVQGRGQVEKDYAAAITKDYGSAIERIQGGDKKSQQADLTGMYASLVTQGFDLKQAQEITAEVARQAGATSAYNDIVYKLGNTIKNTSDAMEVLSTNFGAQLEGLHTSEEQINAFLAVLDNLRRSSADDPIQFGQSVQNITEMIQKTGQLEDSLGEFLIGAGFNEEDRNKMYENLFGGDPVDFGTEKGQQVAESLIRAVNAGLDPKKLKNLSLEQLNIEIGVAEAGQKAKNELNKQMETIIKDLDKQIEGINKLADDSIEKINKEKEALTAAHEARMKQLEAEAKALQDRADLIRDNTDYYIKQLQKEYDAEQYYQKQRETSVGGLQALSQGDIFGYVKSQMQAASDAEQFGREQSIAQIEDTRDAALKNLDLEMKANSDAQQSANDGFQAQMDAKDKEIEKINTERSARIKEINSLKKDAQDIIDLAAGEVATTKLQAFEDKAIGIADKLPAKMKTNVIAATTGVVEDFNVALNDAVGTAAKNLGVDPMAIAGILEDAYATERGGTERKVLQSLGMDTAYNAPGFKIQPTGTKAKNPTGGKVIPVSTLNSGGIVGGIGSTDRVPAMLTPGEFVVNKNAARKNMGNLMKMNAGGAIGYNTGGFVGGMPALGFQNGGVVPNYKVPSVRHASMASNNSTENEVKYITVNQSVIVNGANQSAGDIANQVIGKLNKMKREVGSKYGSVMM